MTRKKLTILGAGPGGYVAAVRAAQNGCDVTIIERESPGGVCLRHGCIPVKALLASARVYTQAKNAKKYGVACDNVTFDYSCMSKRKDDVVAINEKGIESLLQKNKVRLIRGNGRLLSSSQVTCDKSDGSVAAFDSDAVIIATGSSSAIPGFIDLDQSLIFDCEGALALNTLPESCIVLGGGILGCEFASLFADLGVRVIVIEKLAALLPGWDKDLAQALSRSFKRRKVAVRTGTAVEEVTRDTASARVAVRLAGGAVIEADACLVALGRKPNVEGIGLDKSGVALREEPPRGIAVDTAMKTSAPNIYAVGDVTGIRMLAHVATAQGITAADDLAGIASPVRYDAVPECFWAEPELASAGMTEHEAKGKGIDISISTFQYRALGIAHALGTLDGFVKTIAEKETGKVLGVHICGSGAPDMIAEASVIVTQGLTVSDIEDVIHAHPTRGEIVKESILGAKGRNIHG